MPEYIRPTATLLSPPAQIYIALCNIPSNKSMYLDAISPSARKSYILRFGFRFRNLGRTGPGHQKK